MFAHSLRALRHRNYRLFFAGQLISLIGTWMQSIAQSWLVYRLTGSSLLLGVTGFASQLPVFLLAMLGGAVADRHERHRIIIATQIASMSLAFVLAALTLSDRIEVWHVILLASLLGTVNAFDIPARQAFIERMVGREDLLNAIALNSSMFNGARIIGPAIAGILVAKFGEGWCFLGNALSYIAVIIGLLMMQFDAAPAVTDTEPALKRIADGVRFVKNAPRIRALLVLIGLISLFCMPYAVLMPVFANRILGGGPGALGFLMSSAGVGALSGALILTAKSGTKGLGRWVAAAAASFGACLFLFSFSRNVHLSALLLVPAGFSLIIQMASSNTLIQSMCPDHLRGRVMAIYSMMFMGMAPFGAMYAGSVAHWIGAPMTVASGGVISICGALVFHVHWNRITAISEHAQ